MTLAFALVLIVFESVFFLDEGEVRRERLFVELERLYSPQHL